MSFFQFQKGSFLKKYFLFNQSFFGKQVYERFFLQPSKAKWEFPLK